MTFTYIAIAVILVLLAAAASYWLWRRRRATDNNAVQVSSGGRFGWLRFWRRRDDLTERLRSWVADKAGDRKVAAWFAELPEAEARRIALELRSFAKDIGFELDWVLNEEKLADDKLEKELRQVVVQRLKARYTSDQVADNIEIYKQYLQVLGNPARHATLIQALYSELVSRDLAPTTPPEIVMAPSVERRRFLIEKVQDAADKNWTKFAEAMQAAEATVSEQRSSRRFRIQMPTLRRNTQASAPAAEASPTPNDDKGDEPTAPASPNPAPAPA